MSSPSLRPNVRIPAPPNAGSRISNGDRLETHVSSPEGAPHRVQEPPVLVARGIVGDDPESVYPFAFGSSPQMQQQLGLGPRVPGHIESGRLHHLENHRREPTTPCRILGSKERLEGPVIRFPEHGGNRFSPHPGASRLELSGRFDRRFHDRGGIGRPHQLSKGALPVGLPQMNHRHDIHSASLDACDQSPERRTGPNSSPR